MVVVDEWSSPWSGRVVGVGEERRRLARVSSQLPCSWPSLRDVPAAQSKQNEATRFEVFPGAHAVQSAKLALEKVPAAQGGQPWPPAPAAHASQILPMKVLIHWQVPSAQMPVPEHGL